MKTIYETPELVQTFELDELWAVAGGMADQFLTGVTDTVFERMMLVIQAMKPDFACITLNIIKNRDKNKFMVQMRNCESFEKFENDYVKYIVD